MKRPSSKHDEPPSRPLTFRAAHDLGPFELAKLWVDSAAWPIDERTQYDELSELAVMSALRKWLRRWQPIAIHGAMLAGARPEAVAGALGDSLQVAFDRWHEWAVQQRDFILGDKPGITAEEYETVARRFATFGVNLGSLPIHDVVSLHLNRESSGQDACHEAELGSISQITRPSSMRRSRVRSYLALSLASSRNSATRPTKHWLGCGIFRFPIIDMAAHREEDVLKMRSYC